ncbi:MAG: ion transporter [Bacteroidota bacterium]
MYYAAKKKVHGLLHPEIVGDSRWDKVINSFIIILIILNVVAVMLETVSSFHDTYEKQQFFHYFDLISVIIFSIEYVLRVWSSNHEEKYKHPLKGRLRYMVSPAALIDLLAILPSALFYMHVFVGVDLRVLRILRLMRFFRLFRLTSYLKSARLVINVFKSKFNELLLAFVLTMFLIIIASCLVYFAEHIKNPKQFSSIPATMWWAIVTLATVGYGDIVPITVMGKVFASIIILAGVALLALPAGIITSGFLDEMRKLRQPQRLRCPHCGKEFEPDHSHEEH